MTITADNQLLNAIVATPSNGRPIPDAATGTTMGYAPQHTAADVEQAVAAARRAQPAWAALGHDRRAEILHRLADEVESNAEELARIIAQEQGKPLGGMGARFEAAGCAVWLRSAADTPLEPEVLFEAEGTRSELHFTPMGVVGAISPWNWPALIARWQIAPALRMGNTVVAKPSEYTPLSVLAVVELLNRHLPDGVLTAVVGNGDAGAALAAHPDVDKVMFTGSTTTGRKIVEASAGNLARLTLELGGNDPGIVLPGADVSAIAEGVLGGAFINTGQTCAALKRLYVHDSIYDEMVTALAELASETKLGPGLDEESQMGPLTTAEQFGIVTELVADAKQHGGRIVTGGEAAPDLGPHFFQPTIIADIADGTRLVDEEQFGPVLPVIRYSSVDERSEEHTSELQSRGHL